MKDITDDSDLVALQCAVVPHTESHVSALTGDVILIRCECPMQADHTYAQWVERFGRFDRFLTQV